MEDKQVYWDDEKKMFYWIEWTETGNNDIPKRHYISLVNQIHVELLKLQLQEKNNALQK